MNPVILPLTSMTATHLVAFMAFQAVPIVAPDAARDLGIDPGLVGFYTSVAYAGGMLSALSSGALIPRWGPVRLCQVTLAVAAVGMALTASGSLAVAILAAFVVGLGHGPITPSAAHLLRATSPPSILSFVFSIKQASVPLGLTIAGAALPPIVLLYGWQAALLLVGALCVACAALLQPVRARYDVQAEVPPPMTLGAVLEPLRLVATLPALRELTAIAVGLGTGMFCFTTFIVVYLTGTIGFGLVDAGLFLAASQAAGMVARVVWGALADYCGRPRLVLAGIAAVDAACMLLLGYVGSDWPYWAMYGLCVTIGACAVGWSGVLLAEAARKAPSHMSGAAIAGLTTVFGFAMIFIPSGFSIAVTTIGSYRLGFAVVAGVTLLCALALLRPAPETRAGRRPGELLE